MSPARTFQIIGCQSVAWFQCKLTSRACLNKYSVCIVTSQIWFLCSFVNLSPSVSAVCLRKPNFLKINNLVHLNMDSQLFKLHRHISRLALFWSHRHASAASCGRWQSFKCNLHKNNLLGLTWYFCSY